MENQQTKTHELKCWTEFFEAQLKGLKPFDVRENDRDFKVGDCLIQKEWNPKTAEYTGRVLVRKIIYIMNLNDVFVLGRNLVAMSVVPDEVKDV